MPGVISEAEVVPGVGHVRKGPEADLNLSYPPTSGTGQKTEVEDAPFESLTRHVRYRQTNHYGCWDADCQNKKIEIATPSFGGNARAPGNLQIMEYFEKIFVWRSRLLRDICAPRVPRQAA